MCAGRDAVGSSGPKPQHTHTHMRTHMHTHTHAGTHTSPGIAANLRVHALDGFTENGKELEPVSAELEGVLRCREAHKRADRGLARYLPCKQSQSSKK